MQTALKIKTVFDVLFLILLCTVPVFSVFRCFKYLRIGVFGYSYNDRPQGFPFNIAYAGSECPDLVFLGNCDLLSAWKTGGILYLCISTAAFVLAVLSLANILGPKLGLRGGFFRIWLFNYLYPLTYMLGVVVYFYVAGLYSFRVSPILTDDYSIQEELGCYIIYTCAILSLISSVFYTFAIPEAENVNTSLLVSINK